jgi:hypothetical protein
MKKIVICRPQGGFNDILCQVVKCYIYCRKFDRDLYVDTGFDGNQYFKESLGEYFSSKCRHLKFNEIPRFYSGETSVFPKELSETGDEYEYDFDDLSRSYLLRGCRKPITFDFALNYDEHILVHHASGGGTESSLFFAIAEFRPSILKQIEDGSRHIPQSSIGVHVRFTDYRSDYSDILERLGNENAKHVFLCSDSDFIHQQFDRYLDSTSVHSYSSLKGGQPIHLIEGNASEEAIQKLNFAMLRDLVVLSKCNRIYIAPLNNLGEISPDKYSGFSMLALRMNILNEGFFKKLCASIAFKLKIFKANSDPAFTSIEIFKLLFKYSILSLRRSP